MSVKIKEGFVQRYKQAFLSNKWKNSFAVLYSDSTFAFFNERNDPKPCESIFLRDLVPYICVGLMTDRMPVRRPELPPGAVQRLVGIGMDPRASKVVWILFASEQVFEEWINAIITTLPKSNFSQAEPQQMQGNTKGIFVPPARYPNMPAAYPLNDGGSAGQPGGTYSQQNSYPYAQPQPSPYAYPPPQQQTVIVDRNSGYGSSFAGGASLSSGLAAGMGGALLGSLVGYGIGSCFAPHYGFGGGFGGMAPYGGMGGGFIQDNDTFVTNNYYVNEDSGNTLVTDTDTTNYDTSYDDTGNNFGADDYSGGGGDFGGGDFGGGDW